MFLPDLVVAPLLLVILLVIPSRSVLDPPDDSSGVTLASIWLCDVLVGLVPKNVVI